MGEIVGLKVVEVRPMTPAELEAEGWDASVRRGAPPALVLEGGVVLYASIDPEGNGPGALFGYRGEERFML